MLDGGRDLYAVLGIAPDATPDIIKSAYRTLAKQYHPDLGGAGQIDATPKFIELQARLPILSDPISRAEYDNNNIETQAQEFEASSDDENRAEIDPDEIWRSVANDHPEIDGIHAHLQNISLALANRYRIAVIDGAYGEDPAIFAFDLEKAFFQRYFGPSPEIIELAKHLLATGHRDAAKQLNRAVKEGRLETDRLRAAYVRRVRRRYFSASERKSFDPKAYRAPKPKLFGRIFGATSVIFCIALITHVTLNYDRTFLSSIFSSDSSSSRRTRSCQRKRSLNVRGGQPG